jgi:hypothetical protein
VNGTKYTAKIVITVELTAPHASVKKVGKTKTEWSEKEIEKDEE